MPILYELIYCSSAVWAVFGFMEGQRMTRKKFPKSRMMLCAAIMAAVPAWADISLNPYVLNSGFETLNSPLMDCGTSNGTPGLYCNASVAGWSGGGTGSGSVGTVQLSMTGPTGQSGPAYAQTHLLPAQGNNAAYINNYDQFSASASTFSTDYVYLAQTLNDVTLQPNTAYSLTYEVARRADDVGGHFRIQVNAVSGTAIEGVNYWILAGDTTSFAVGQWITETLTFTTPVAGLFNATPTVFLVNDGSDAGYQGTNSSVAQIEFDTPEPGFYGLLALSLGTLSVAVRRRKSV
jgi:hypothetical protein